nr:uncharacterized protein LOC129478456 [Symphalangus syndactylus]
MSSRAFTVVICTSVKCHVPAGPGSEIWRGAERGCRPGSAAPIPHKNSQGLVLGLRFPLCKRRNDPSLWWRGDGASAPRAQAIPPGRGQLKHPFPFHEDRVRGLSRAGLSAAGRRRDLGWESPEKEETNREPEGAGHTAGLGAPRGRESSYGIRSVGGAARLQLGFRRPGRGWRKKLGRRHPEGRHEDPGKSRPSACEAERPWEKPPLLAPPPRTSSLQNCENISLFCLPAPHPHQICGTLLQQPSGTNTAPIYECAFGVVSAAAP